MVRYSKLPFRLLVQDYGVDITYTPMMLAHEFIRHPIARDSDFTTHRSERGPLIAQFASNDPEEFARAAQMIGPWVDGIDLNCGCPQSWAIKEGIGCSLMSSPLKVAEMVKAAKLVFSGTEKSVSVKIRIHKDLSETVEFLRIVRDVGGVDFITVHGRTKNQRSSTPPDVGAIKLLRDTFPTLPMLANGDVFTLTDAMRLAAETGVDGVMAARGLQENPALFAGYDETPLAAVGKFMAYAVRSGLRFELVRTHLADMMGKMTTKKERQSLIACRDLLELTDWLDNRFELGR